MKYEFDRQGDTQKIDLTSRAGDGRARGRALGPVHDAMIVSVREVQITI